VALGFERWTALLIAALHLIKPDQLSLAFGVGRDRMENMLALRALCRFWLGQHRMALGTERDSRDGTLLVPLRRAPLLAIVQNITIDGIDRTEAGIAGMIENDQILFARRGAKAASLALNIADDALGRTGINDAGRPYPSFRPTK
jgi:hypothetical protein